jgi:hypothetical protein
MLSRYDTKRKRLYQNYHGRHPTETAGLVVAKHPVQALPHENEV